MVFMITQQIYSLNELSHYYIENTVEESPIEEIENDNSYIKVLLLDFDLTCATAAVTFANEHFYYWLANQNSAHGKIEHGHFDFVIKARETIPFRTCEDTKQVNDLLGRFREESWVIKILTARTEDGWEAMARNLIDSGLDIGIDSVIFSERLKEAPVGSTKGKSVIKWVKGDPSLRDAKKIQLVFVDDLDKHCKAVRKVPEELPHVTVDSFQFVGESVDSKIIELSKAQLSDIIVQYYDYVNHQKIRASYCETELREAQAALEINEISNETVYKVMSKAIEIFNTMKSA